MRTSDPGISKPLCNALLASVLSVLGACSLQSYTPEPVEPLLVSAPDDINDPRLRAALPEADSWPPASWDLSMLIAVAMQVHPALETARARIRIAEAAHLSAGARPNPVIQVPGEYHSRIDDEDSNRLGIGFGFSWLLQARGSREAALAAAQARQQASEFDLLDQAWQIRQGVRAAWADLYFARLRTDTLNRALELAQAQEQLVADRVSAGEEGGFALSQAALSAQRYRLQRLQQELTRVNAAAALAQALGLSTDVLGADIALEGLRERLDPGELPAADTLQREALTSRPDILAALSRYAAAEAGLERQIARQMPDITLSPSWFYEQGDNIWQLAAGLPVPILNQNEGPIADARAQRSLAAAQFRLIQTNCVTQLGAARARFAAASEALRLAEQIKSQSGEALRVAGEQAEGGYSDPLQVLQLEQAVVNAELAVIDLRVKVYAALGSLEDAVRKPLDGSVYPQLLPEPRTQEQIVK